ncbi:hypothetical protein TA3x_002876 [Tundrisphaera sp. TA3]|uniref:hypothetical protein n=1 Tax=Tundrisphaera sp. TA3 TaxID=3435775 RepID=UPI003EBC098B
MNLLGRSWMGIAAAALAGLLHADSAQAQFGLSINTPGASVAVGSGYTSYYPQYLTPAPVVVAPAPVVVAPAPIYGPRPYYPPRPYGYGYGYGRGYYGGRPPYYGGPRGPYGPGPYRGGPYRY